LPKGKPSAGVDERECAAHFDGILVSMTGVALFFLL